MKKLCNGLFLSATVFFMACGGDKSTDTTTTMTEDTMNSSMNNTMMADTGMNSSHNMNNTNAGATVDLSGAAGANNFVSTAASGGMMEVELAKIAQQNGASKEVKDLAKMIQTDHTAANNELKKIATGKSITIPAAMMPEHRSHVDNMKAMKGSEFDKAYLDMMAMDHTKDIDLFTQASNKLEDAELKAFAGKTLPTLQKHLDKVKSTQSKM